MPNLIQTVLFRWKGRLLRTTKKIHTHHKTIDCPTIPKINPLFLWWCSLFLFGCRWRKKKGQMLPKQKHHLPVRCTTMQPNNENKIGSSLSSSQGRRLFPFAESSDSSSPPAPAQNATTTTTGHNSRWSGGRKCRTVVFLFVFFVCGDAWFVRALAAVALPLKNDMEIYIHTYISIMLLSPNFLSHPGTQTRRTVVHIWTQPQLKSRWDDRGIVRGPLGDIRRPEWWW